MSERAPNDSEALERAVEYHLRGRLLAVPLSSTLTTRWR